MRASDLVIPALAFLLTLPAGLVAQVVEDDFIPPASFPLCIAVQPDDKVLIAGTGAAAPTLFRVLPDGTPDPGFPPVLASGSGARIDTLVVQPDGKLVIGGWFTGIGGVPRSNLARLHADGTLDEAFDPGEGVQISSLVLQPDGKLIAAPFWSSTVASGIRRINPDGSDDPSFEASSTKGVTGLALQPDGKILVGSYNETIISGVPLDGMARLNPDGSVDRTFTCRATAVHAIAVQPDGNILIGGRFTTVNGVTRRALARLRPNGTLDTSFNASVADAGSFNTPEITSIVLQTDGRIVIGGAIFDSVRGVARRNLARLNADGSLDAEFNIGKEHGVLSLALQRDGRLIVGGHGKLGDQQLSVGRLSGTGPVTETLALDGTNLSWQRGGTSPEVWRTEFDYSTDGGVTWYSLGGGNRMPGGWALGGVSVPEGASIRSRGFVAVEATGTFVQSGIGAPFITAQPARRTDNAGTTAKFYASAEGTGPLEYRWKKDGVDLVDGGHISGAGTPVLTFNDVTGQDAAQYDLVVSNALGSVTSEAATLTVIDPFISAHPRDAWVAPGEATTFTVSAAGAGPFEYEWRQDGDVIPGAIGDTLVVKGSGENDGSVFTVRVSNAFGQAQSAPARLTVTPATVDDFDPGIEDPVDLIGPIRGFAVLRDGRILVAGNDMWFADRTHARRGLARVDEAGVLDPDFETDSFGWAGSPAILPDDRILVLFGRQLPDFSIEEGVMRLHPDGTRDETFHFLAEEREHLTHILPLPDGRAYLGGVVLPDPDQGGEPRPFLIRLGADGVVDPTFDTGLIGIADENHDDALSAVVLQRDGMVMIGGSFEAVDGVPRFGLARLDASGAVDLDFVPPASLGSVSSIAPLPDGKVLVGGSPAGFGSRNLVFARLESDGTLDPSFQPDPSVRIVFSLAAQADGRIVALTLKAGGSRTEIAQFRPEGSFDPAFRVGQNPGSIDSFAIQPDGRILVGGYTLGSLSGKPRSKVARISATYPAIESLAMDGSTLRWLRGGSSPEVAWVTFEATSDGVNWLLLGDGARVPGGWELTGVTLAANAAVRARGFLSGPGSLGGSGSSWFVETVLLSKGSRLQVSSPRLLPDGAFRFDVTGPEGWRVLIESSVDLRTWSPLGRLELGPDATPFTDPDPTSHRHRTYRARFP